MSWRNGKLPDMMSDDLPEKWKRRLVNAMKDTNLWLHLLTDFDFSWDDEENIEQKVSGSTDAIRKLGNLLRNKEGLTIDRLILAFNENNLHDAKDELQDLRGDSVFFNKLLPQTCGKIFTKFAGKNGHHLADGWQGLLKDLELDEHTGYIDCLGLGKYTHGKGLLDLLIEHDVTIGQFKDKLHAVNSHRQVNYDINSVRDELDDALQAMTSCPLDFTKVVQSTNLKLSFSVKALKKKYWWFWLFSYEESILKADDCDMDAPLFISIQDEIIDTFDEFLRHNIQIETDRYHIQFNQPELVKAANYLLFEVIVSNKDGSSIPKNYNLSSTPESKHLWGLLKKAIGKASELDGCNVKVGLKHWKVGSIVITVSLTKDIKCFWRNDEIERIREKIKYYSSKENLPDNLGVVSVEPDEFIMYDIEIMTFDEETANAVSIFQYDFEEALVGNAVNGSPKVHQNRTDVVLRTTVARHVTKEFGEVPQTIKEKPLFGECAVSNPSAAAAAATEEGKTGTASHVCFDSSGELVVLVHEYNNVKELLFQDQIKYEDIRMNLQLGGGTEILKQKEWIKFCFEKYSKDRPNVADTGLVLLKKCGDWRETFARIVQESCNNSFDNKIFMTDNYEILQHFSFYGLNESEIAQQPFRSYAKVFEYYEHIFAFLPQWNILLVLIIVDLNKKKNIFLQINRGLHSLPCAAKKYIEIHHKYLREGKIQLVTSLAIPELSSAERDSLKTNITRQERMDSGSCMTCVEKLILGEDQLGNKNGFQNWLEDLNVKQDAHARWQSELAESRREFIVQIQAFMDTRSLRTTDKVGLTRHLLLTELQQNILSDESLKVVVHGAYGSGKSVVLQLRLLKLIKELKTDDVIFFLTFNKKSLLLQHMKELTGSIKKKDENITIHAMNLDEMANHFNVPNITLTQFIEEISKSSGNHAIIDEFAPVDISHDDAEKINKLIKSPNLARSCIWMAAVPVTRSRTFGGELLFEDTGAYVLNSMKHVSLNRTFRCSKEIHELVRITTEVIESHPSKFYGVSGSQTETVEETDPDAVTHTIADKKIEGQSKTKVEYKRQDEICDAADQLTPLSSLQPLPPLASLPQLPDFPHDKSETPEIKDPPFLRGDVIDEMIKEASGQKKEKGEVSLDTSFRFEKSSDCEVSLGKPLLIKPFPEDHSSDSIGFDEVFRVHIAMEIANLDVGRIAIICTNLHEYEICLQALLLQKELHKKNQNQEILSYLPTLQEKRYGKALELSAICKQLLELKNFILLTDIDGATGMEFLKVVLPVTPSEEFQSYTLVRSITRCQSELVLMQFPWYYDTDNPITAEIIKAWKVNGAVRQKCVQIKKNCTCGDISSQQLPYCICVTDSAEGEHWQACPHTYVHQNIYDCYERVKEMRGNKSLKKEPSHLSDKMTYNEFVRKIMAAWKANETKKIIPRKEIQNFPGDRDPFNDINYEDLELREEIGRGAFGTVHRALYQDTIVAIKVIDIGNGVKEYQEEVQELSKVRHDNIIQLYGTSKHEDKIYIVMEFADCGSLYDLLHPLPEEFRIEYNLGHVVRWSLQCTRAIEYLHSHKPKIVHRDLKSPNMLLTNLGRVTKLCDFGTATQVKTEMTSNKGSAAWMAPEVFEGKRYSEKCDTYSFGIVLWEMLSRKIPYSDIGEPAFRILWAVYNGTRPPPLKNIPDCLMNLMHNCWAKDTTKRPPFAELVKFFTLLDNFVPGGDEPIF